MERQAVRYIGRQEVQDTWSEKKLEIQKRQEERDTWKDKQWEAQRKIGS